MNKILYIIRGIPGVGKSTLAKKLVGNDLIFEADKYFIDEKGKYIFDASKLGAAHAWCLYNVELAMREGNDSMVVSNTFTTEKELKPYLEVAKDRGYDVVSIVLEKRHPNHSIHLVPEEKVKQMAEKLKNNIKLI